MKTFAIAMLFVILAAAGASAGEWTETVKVNGDLRYRHERFDVEGKEIRNRQRVRARVSIIAEPEDNLELGFRLVSGGDDPISSNQTLDDAFTTKHIMLDRAYFAWTHVPSNTTVTGGKMGNPFFVPAKSELLWDGDLSPEGVAVNHAFGEGDTKLLVNGAGLWIDERSSDKNAALFGGQAVLVQQMDGVQVSAGGSYFNYTDLMSPLYDDDFSGNTSVTVGEDVVFANDFNLVEFFVALGFKAGDQPVTIFADFVTNQEASDHEQGYVFGAQLGKAKKPGSWQVKYNYREVQADAVMGALTDSDFRGGGTDGKGHEFGCGYQLSGKSTLAVTCFVNKQGIEDGTDFNRLMVDFKFKF